jgi:prepilin-type N-terminal cleavage/methylation domain-containing protein
VTARARAGFTLVELLLVAVLGSLVIGALYQAHVQQTRFSVWENQVVRDHDAFRVAESVLAGDLREVVAAAGDVEQHTPDSLSVRAPVGFGLVCSVRANPASIGVTRSQGRMWSDPADSLLVYTSGGWRTVEPTGEQTSIPASLYCPFGTPLPDHLYRLDRGAADSVPVGAPVRVFRRRTYHVGTNRGEPWLARTDADGTQMLVGPIAAGGLRFRLLDEKGLQTSVLADVTGIETQLVLPLTPITAGSSATADTLLVAFQGRNR